MQKEIDVHEYPSGKQVITAFTSLDWIIYDKNNAIINAVNTGNQLKLRQNVKNTFQIQKNRQNEQKITLKAGDKHQKICPVQAIQDTTESQETWPKWPPTTRRFH
jgi:hypothetical protein